MTARICVFGSANMDLVVYVDRAPGMGETVSGRRFTTVPGGKGANQAVAAARAGGDVRMAGAVGADAHGAEILDVLGDAGIDVGPVERGDDPTGSEPTGTAHIVVEDSGDNAIVVVPGANGTVTHPTDRQRSAIEGADLLLLQLETPLEGVIAAAELGRAAGVRVVLTPAPAIPLPAKLYAAVDLLVPNQHEVRLLAADADAGVDRAARALLERVPEVVVTLGSAGSRWYHRAGEPVAVPARQVAAVDTTGAGDTFVGALAVALGEGRPMQEAMSWATAGSAVSVQRPGASSSMPWRAEIDAEHAA